jgi:hypothetical protein
MTTSSMAKAKTAAPIEGQELNLTLEGDFVTTMYDAGSVAAQKLPTA